MITRLLRTFASLLAGVAVSASLGSCIYEGEPAPAADELHADGLVDVRIRFKAAAASSEEQTGAPVEKVKSVRVIMIDQATGALDLNEKIPVGQVEASVLDQQVNGRVATGKKHVYILGNEESVGAVSLTSVEGLPTELPLTSLTDLLDYFRFAEEEDAPAGSPDVIGAILEKVLNRIYFANHYADISEGGAIYLPYSAMYPLAVSGKSVTVDEPMYLVPVATKFDITLVNYRAFNVQIDDIMLSSVNSHNHVFAQLHDDETYRQLPGDTSGTKVWWVDWLQQCASDTQTALDNESINTKWGWIKNYYLPLPAEELKEVSLHTDGSLWQIPALRDKDNPSTLSVGPYYMPESINLTEAGSADQAYYLSFRLRDAQEAEYTWLPDNVLENVKALFRATHVVVTVEFNEKDISIYSQIEPWKPVFFHGYLTEDD